jgi:predicted membrane-bound spermidine synthase
MRRHQQAITAIFMLSGAAGLTYEIVWSRQLVLIFGNTTQAIAAILTGYFAGMAIGNLIGKRPVTDYFLLRRTANPDAVLMAQDSISRALGLP